MRKLDAPIRSSIFGAKAPHRVGVDVEPPGGRAGVSEPLTSESKLTVVVAEDEYLISCDVVSAAQRAGYDVVGVAADGEQALELVRERSPGAAILDVKMPRLDGLEVARRLRDESPIPVVLLTAYESRETIAAAREAGVGAYLVKPPESGALQRAMELAVARHQDLMDLRRVNAELQQALARIRRLEGLISICMYCKKVRNEAQDWQQIEHYLTEHTDAWFSHGMCPACYADHFPADAGTAGGAVKAPK
jgi:AmiR/NasT family two-component response regulator